MTDSIVHFVEYEPVAPVRVVRAYHSLLPNLWGEGPNRRFAAASLVARLIAALPDVRDGQAEDVRQALADARAALRESGSPTSHATT